jgi:1-acyl-sn-glycerol-3-phosphate acyltransferase
MNPGKVRRAFLRDKTAIAGVGLSRFEGEETRLVESDVRSSDWLPGAIAAAYGTKRDDLQFLAPAIAIKDHVAQWASVHPSTVSADSDLRSAACKSLPLTRFPVEVTQNQGEVVVRDRGSPFVDMTSVFQFWRTILGQEIPVFEEIFNGLAARFLKRVVLTAPESFDALKGKRCLYLGNHQTQIESLLITAAIGGLSQNPVVTLANAKHEKRWIGQLLNFIASYPGARDPGWIRYFDQSNPASLLGIVADFKRELQEGGKSVMVHAEGTRARSCRQRVVNLSSLFLDLALEADIPIVPVRFAGGLPIQPVDGKLEFPVNYTGQYYYFGAPIFPEALRSMPLIERKTIVLDAINELGPSNDNEHPNAPDLTFASQVDELQKQWSIGEVQAVLLRVIQDSPSLRGVQDRSYRFAEDAQGAWLRQFVTWLIGEQK